MKRQVFLLALVALMSAATASAQGFHLGVKAGANMFKIPDQAFKDGFQYGYNLGGFAQINFTKKWGIQPEVLWSESSYKTAQTINGVIPQDFNVKLNYLQIPLLLNFSPSKLFTFQAGPQFGILIDENVSAVNNGRNAFKKGDLSMLGGAQLNLGPLNLGGRYVIGLNQLGDITQQTSWKNQGWQVYAGFKLF